MSSKSISIPHDDGFHLKFCRILYFLFLISLAGCKKGALPVDSVVTQKTTPFITFIQPANDSANVSTDSRIYASFSQAMDSTTMSLLKNTCTLRSKTLSTSPSNHPNSKCLPKNPVQCSSSFL